MTNESQKSISTLTEKSSAGFSFEESKETLGGRQSECEPELGASVQWEDSELTPALWRELRLQRWSR